MYTVHICEYIYMQRAEDNTQCVLITSCPHKTCSNTTVSPNSSGVVLLLSLFFCGCKASGHRDGRSVSADIHTHVTAVLMASATMHHHDTHILYMRYSLWGQLSLAINTKPETVVCRGMCLCVYLQCYHVHLSL